MNLESYDKEIYALLNKELERQCDHLEMIASENFTYPEVMEVMGSVLTNKYAEGYPGKRYYGGCEFVDEIEQIAIDRCKKLFGCEFCLCFWTNLVICLLLVLITGNFALLVVPTLSTPLTRYIV